VLQRPCPCCNRRRRKTRRILGWPRSWGANRWHNPPERGGSQDLAIGTHQKGLQAARFHKSEIADPLAPSWGEPELLLNLAWANLRRNSPDLVAAEQ
jgi:hypothetical protein